MKVFVLNTGGTLGMVGQPLRPAKSAEDLLAGVNVPREIDLTLEDFESRQDSTNIIHAERIQMAQSIAKHYDDHDAFVILHGTDSMAETTTVLCMIFKLSLQKPVFVIGAQMTKDEPGQDVTMQIENTLRIAVAFVRSGVAGVYNVCISDVWDGSRLRKRAESDVMAFHTPGRHPVAKCWPHVFLGEGLREQDRVLAVQGLRLDTQFERRVATIRVSADTTPWLLEGSVKEGKLAGVILEAKGTGNIPDRPWDEEYSTSWIDVIKIATDAGVHVAILSPFEDGRVDLTRYELGQKAAAAGALSLESLTPDMADVKFRQAIAMHPKSPKRIQEFLSTNIVGELLPGVMADQNQPRFRPWLRARLANQSRSRT